MKDHTLAQAEGVGPAEASRAAGTSGDQATRIVAIASTFTAEPLVQPLQFWMDSLQIPGVVGKASYAQVLQEFLRPDSAFGRNTGGWNVALIRLEDWIAKCAADEDEKTFSARAEGIARDLLEALESFSRRAAAPTLVFFAPESLGLSEAHRYTLRDLRTQLISKVGSFPHIHCLDHDDLVRLYPIPRYEDARADEIGHIPYTGEYFIALATFVARRIAALAKPQFKVIALDCDNTLWKGICGEDGATGVKITPAHRQLQEMLVRQHDGGVLLCLCSKNNPTDVEAVFKANPDMPLQERHIVTSRVNWEPKSANLCALAEELKLGLDSFLFIDDSPMECAEVRTNCPAVLALQLPQDSAELLHFTQHVWAFDRLKTTAESKHRTAQYRENKARDEELRQAENLDQFIASLRLEVDVAEMQTHELDRVAELIQRTNQFNLTAIRRHATQLQALLAQGQLRCLVARVRDRFGDYGLVGALLFRETAEALDVDTFVLSCRVLGRGVEHRIVRECGRIAREANLSWLVLRCRETARNAPARKFVEKSFSAFRSVRETVGVEQIFTIPVADAERLSHGSELEEVVEEGDSKSVRPQAASTVHWHDVAWNLSRLPAIVEAFHHASQKRGAALSDHVAPRTPVEAAVADIWREVLGVADISVRANFFDLGGDSVRAVQAIARIESVLGLQLSVYEFFEGQTIEQIAGRLTGAGATAEQIEIVARSGGLPLSWAQQRLWFIDELEGGSPAYQVPLAVRMRGDLDRSALQASLAAIVNRHETLRTKFVKVDGEPLQEIVPDALFPLQLADIGDVAAEKRAAKLEALGKAELSRPFNLRTGPLIRGLLVRLAPQEHVLFVTMHHICSDGWSIRVLIRELAALYAAFSKGLPDPLPPLPIQYADYAHWQRQRLSGDELNRQLAYWKAHLQGAPDLLELPTDRPRPAIKSYRGASVQFRLSTTLTAELRALARRSNLTLAMTMYAAWAVLLARLSSQNDIVIGMPVANRRRTELEGMIGFFLNTLAVRVSLHDDPPIVELLKRVRTTLLNTYSHQDAPFEQVVEAVQPARNLVHSPVFQVMLVLQTISRCEMQLPGMTLVEEEVPLQAAEVDLTLALKDVDGKIEGSLRYASDLFDETTIRRWIASFEAVAQGMVSHPQLRASELPIMSEEERERLLSFSQPVEVSPTPVTTLPELFEVQVERTPDRCAVRFGDRELSYRQLNERANRLAHYLRAAGAEPNRLVGLCLERGIEMVVGVLGILKSGAAYVPLDPNYPEDRLHYMVGDAAPVLVLTQRSLESKLPPGSARSVAIDRDGELIGSESPANLSREERGSSASDLAYVIYTSGSTGKPKGVMVEHCNVIRLLTATDRWFHFDERDVWTLFHSIAFDFSVWELWGALLYGGRLIVVPHMTARSPDDFYRLLCDEGVTVLNQTPSAFSEVVSAQGRNSGRTHSLRFVIFGGEALELRTLRPWVERNGPHSPQLVNMYGITETTVHVTYCPLTAEQIASERRSVVGRAIPDLGTYLLDEKRNLVPIGVTGEIYVGGAGVARGYLNRPELTAERFVENPFVGRTGSRLYKSGDLARWRSDGTLEYLGRNDHQVKIRGFRIELGEIEAQLASYAGVAEARVLAREDVPGEKRLVAYVISEGKKMPGLEAMRAWLKQRLPEYMVPGAFVTLDRFPLTQNGKLDQRALPAPDRAAFALREYEAPEGTLETTLASVWQGLLRVERISRRDDFFEIGGHSLLATRVMSRLRELLGVEVPVRALFEARTLDQLAVRVDVVMREKASLEAQTMDNLARALRGKIEAADEGTILAQIAALELELGDSPRP
jgi:amino acid adenylation domain-containing protein/FkbH-like protein